MAKKLINRIPSENRVGSKISEQDLINYSIGAFLTDEENRTVWINGMPYGNAYISSSETRQPKHAEVFNDFDRNKAEGHYSHAEGGTYVNTVYNNTKIAFLEPAVEGYNYSVPYTNVLYKMIQVMANPVMNIPLYVAVNNEGRLDSQDATETSNDIITNYDAENTLLAIDKYDNSETNTYTGTDSQLENKVTSNEPIKYYIKEFEYVKAEKLIYFNVATSLDPNSVITTLPEYCIGKTMYFHYYYAYDGKDEWSEATKDGAHAEGVSQAHGVMAHSEGFANRSYEDYSHTEGVGNEVYGLAGHAEGDRNIVTNSAPYSHAEGHMNIAKADSVHVEGRNNLGNNTGAHVEGGRNKVDGLYGHAEGYGNNVKGDYGHAEGYGNIVNNENGHAEGTNTVNNGKSSHTEGVGTITTNEGEHAEGQYNVTDYGYISSIGVGSSADNRKNAFTVLSDGRVYIAKTEEIIEDIRNTYNPCNYDGEKLETASKSIQRLLTETTEKMINITYAELVNMKENNLLIPGQYYRIIDYITSFNNTLTDIKSAGNKFDIVVLAGSTNELFEDCYLLFPDANVNNFKIQAENGSFIGTQNVNVYNINTDNNCYTRTVTSTLQSYSNITIKDITYTSNTATSVINLDAENILIRTNKGDFIFDVANSQNMSSIVNIDNFNKRRCIKIAEIDNNTELDYIGLYLLFTDKLNNSNISENSKYVHAYCKFNFKEYSDDGKTAIYTIDSILTVYLYEATSETRTYNFMNYTVFEKTPYYNTVNAALLNYLGNIRITYNKESSNPVNFVNSNGTGVIIYTTGHWTSRIERRLTLYPTDIRLYEKFRGVYNIKTLEANKTNIEYKSIGLSNITINNEDPNYIFLDNIDILNGTPVVLANDYYEKILDFYKDNTNDIENIIINLFGYRVKYNLDNYKYSDYLDTSKTDEFTSYFNDANQTLTYYSIGNLNKNYITSGPVNFWPLNGFDVLLDTKNFTKYNYRWNQVNIFSKDSSDIEQQSNEQSNNYCILTTDKQIDKNDNLFEAVLCNKEQIEDIISETIGDKSILQDINTYNNVFINKILYDNWSSTENIKLVKSTKLPYKKDIEIWPALITLLSNQESFYYFVFEKNEKNGETYYFPLKYCTPESKILNINLKNDSDFSFTWSVDKKYIVSLSYGNKVYSIRLEGNKPKEFNGQIEGKDFTGYTIYEYICTRQDDKNGTDFVESEDFDVFNDVADKSINDIITNYTNGKQWSYGELYILLKQNETGINIVDGYFDIYFIRRDKIMQNFYHGYSFENQNIYNTTVSSTTEKIFHIDSDLSANKYLKEFEFTFYNKENLDFEDSTYNLQYTDSTETELKLGSSYVNYKDIKKYNYVFYEDAPMYNYISTGISDHSIVFNCDENFNTSVSSNINEIGGISISLKSNIENTNTDGVTTYDFKTLFALTKNVQKYTYLTKIKDIENALEYIEYHLPFYYSRGFIYSMEDNNGNKAQYDFLNVQFKDGNNWYYTFDNNGDFGLKNNKTIKNNEIKSNIQIIKNILSTNDSIIVNNTLYDSSIISTSSISLLNNIIKDSKNVQINKDVVNSTFIQFNDKNINSVVANANIYNTYDFEYNTPDCTPVFSVGNFRIYDKKIYDIVNKEGILDNYNTTNANIIRGADKNIELNNCNKYSYVDNSEKVDNVSLTAAIPSLSTNPKIETEEFTYDEIPDTNNITTMTGFLSYSNLFDFGYIYTGCSATYKTKGSQINAPELQVTFKSKATYTLKDTNNNVYDISKSAIKTDFVHKTNCWSKDKWSTYGCNICTHLGLKIGEDGLSVQKINNYEMICYNYEIGKPAIIVGIKLGNNYILRLSKIYFEVTEYKLYGNSTGEYDSLGDGYIHNIGYSTNNQTTKTININTTDMTIVRDETIFNPSTSNIKRVKIKYGSFNSGSDGTSTIIVDTTGIYNKETDTAISYINSSSISNINQQ